MRATTMLFLIVALGVGLACDDSSSPPPAPANLETAGGDLVALLPRSAVAVAELHDVASRWDELRRIERLARLQDRLLAALGLSADDVPPIAGRRAALAFLPDDDGGIVPIAVFDPPAPADARARLNRSGVLAVAEERGAVWAGPATHPELLERAALGDGTSLRRTINFKALDERLPGGGLVRVYLNPGGLRDYLRQRAAAARSTLAGAAAEFLRSELEPIQAAALRRDLVDGELVTDAWIGIDAEALPPAARTAMAAKRAPATFPSDLPADLVAIKSFRLEAAAALAWLRGSAARDPGGPLRNLDFWLREFEARTGRNVQTDIVGALGERGLVMVLVRTDGVEPVAIIDADDPQQLQASLIDLWNWMGEQVWGRSLGLLRPHVSGDDDIAHGVQLRTLFGSFDGPVFQVAGDHLVFALSPRGLRLGVALAAASDSWRTPDWAMSDEGPADEIALFRLSAVGRLMADRPACDPATDVCWPAAIAQFLAGAADARLAVFWEPRGFRIAGRLPIDR